MGTDSAVPDRVTIPTAAVPGNMQTQRSSLIVGNPTFSEPRIEALRQRDGLRAAWQAAFEAHGMKAPALAQGSFAVAITTSRGCVFAATDRFAVRSLCYRVSRGAIHFAERADHLADTDTPINPQALFDYLYFHAIPSPRTVYEGVHRLPPAHVACLEGGTLSVQPYWTPVFEPDPRPAPLPVLQREFLDLLQTAVRSDLGSGKPACFLSGGTDSSTVAGMIGRAGGQPASTYSIGFEAEGYDEMEFARIAARHFGTDHHEYYVTPADLVQSIPAVAAHYDQPFGNSSAVPAYHCARMAGNDGVAQLLAGDGGDELFGGNTRYAKQRTFGWYGALPPALRQMLEPAAAVIAGVPGLGKAHSYMAQARVPMPDRTQTYNLLGRMGTEQVLSAAFLRRVDLNEPLAQQRAVWAGIRAKSLLNQQLAFDWRYTLAENDLPKVCGSAALAGIGVAFPMLHAGLVDFSLRLPTSYKLRGLRLRWFFKQALRGFLPDAIITKRKQGFGLPFGVWLHRHDALRSFARDALGSLSERGIVKPEFICSLMDVRLAEHPAYYGEMIWILLILEHWLRRHAPAYRISD